MRISTGFYFQISSGHYPAGVLIVIMIEEKIQVTHCFFSVNGYNLFKFGYNKLLK